MARTLTRIVAAAALITSLLPATTLADPVTYLNNTPGPILYTGHTSGNSDQFITGPGDYTFAWRANVRKPDAYCIVNLFAFSWDDPTGPVPVVVQELVAQGGYGALEGKVDLPGLKGSGNYYYRVDGCGQYTFMLSPTSLPSADASGR